MRHILVALLILSILALGCFVVVQNMPVPNNTGIVFNDNQSSTRGLFDYQLLPALYRMHGQFVFSPMSLEIALAMAAEGVDGETREQVLSFMGTDQLRKYDFNRYHELKIANAAIVSDKIMLLDVYQTTLEDKYQAEILPMNSDVIRLVNNWANEHTNGMIPEILNEQPNDLLQLMLLNALALEAKWNTPFDPMGSTDRTFHTPEGDVETPFMYQSNSFKYAEADGVQAVKLPYSRSRLELLVILPEQGGLERALDRLSTEGISWLGEFRWVNTVNLWLPKLSTQTELSFAELLQDMGVVLPFSAEGDFSGMTDKTDLFINEILQKVRLDVGEEGTRAAVATMIAGVEASVEELPTDVVDMIVNRPFVLLLRDDALNATLFAAVVTNPSTS